MAKVTKEAREAAALLVELLLAQKRRFQLSAREHALSPQQAATLWNLEPGGTLTMNALADILMCDASNVTGIVDKLEARGLLRRSQGEDRRVKVLSLTAEGESLRETLRGRLLDPPEWLLALSREDQRLLLDILRRGHAAEEPRP
jgi:DNA-binding MarR family transcriptional regulator